MKNQTSLIQLPNDHWGARSLVRADNLFSLEDVAIYRCLVQSAVQDEHGVAHSDAGLHEIVIGHAHGDVLWEQPLYHTPLTQPTFDREGSQFLLTLEGRLHRINPRTGSEEIEHAQYENKIFTKTLKITIPDFEKINLELIEYFSTHPEDLYNLQPRKYEQLIESIFRNQGYRTALGPLSGDKGVDIRLWQKDTIGEIVTLVQLKRYNKNLPVRLEAVQALFGAVESERANRGLFVTTSRFLPGVHDWAKTTGSRITLASSLNVAEWCRQIACKGTFIKNIKKE
ncbi:MAG: restriction endonuclease [Candidatus Brocadiaceae bacterium]|nr:restriction endonuclease [Candidatus Brocadiaceae bacterium]